MGKKLDLLRNILNETDTKQTVFSEGPAPLTQEEKRQLAETVARYSEIVEAMIPQQNLQEMMQEVSNMVEMAGKYIKENEEMVEKLQAGRTHKFIESSCNEAKKACNEIEIAKRRLTAALDDIGEGVKKYF